MTARRLTVLDLGEDDPIDSWGTALLLLPESAPAPNLLRLEILRLAKPDGTYDLCACGNATGTQDEEYDSGEAMFRRWCWTTLVSDGLTVWHLCESCSAWADPLAVRAQREDVTL